MLVIGLTGGIASGKTTASDYFATKGVEIIDTDEIAHSLVLPNRPAYKLICDHFDQRILQADYRIDRAKLREIIFSNEREKQWLENLLHPLIRQEVQLNLNKLKKANEVPYCVIVIPLLVNTQHYPMLDRVLVIDIPVALQKTRLAQRHPFNDKLTDQIIAAQLTRDERLTLADDIIENHRDKNHLIRQLERLHYQYLKLARDQA